MRAMTRGPIYVAGLERSGTSLLYALLTSHPEIAMTRRTNLWTYFYGQYGDLSRPENFERCLETMLRYKRIVVLEPDAERLREEFWQGEPTYGRLFALVAQHYAERAGKRRWGDKSLNTERYADAIFEAYPDATILHIYRDPRDRYASAVTRWKVSRGGIGAGTAVWVSSMRLLERNTRRHPGRYLGVRYETLAAEPEVTLREICDVIGEAYTPAMLTMRGAETFRDEGGNSSYEEREPGTISTSSIGRYAQVLSSQQLRFMQGVAGGRMWTYGYMHHPARLTVRERLEYALGVWPLNIARMAAWYVMNTVENMRGRSLPAYRIVNRAPAPGGQQPSRSPGAS